MGDKLLDTTVTIDEEVAFTKLSRKIIKVNEDYYDRIVTSGRGGLSVAQRLAYILDVPVYVTTFKDELRHLTKGDLYVDDIVCTGDTIGLIPRYVDVATLVARQSARYQPTYTGLLYTGPEYIKFTWES